MTFERLIEFLRQLENTSERLKMFKILAELFTEVRPAEADRVVYLTQGALGPPFRALETGLSEKLVIKAVARASGQKAGRVDELFGRLGDLGAVAETLMADPAPKDPGSLFDLLEEPMKAGTVIEVYDVLLKIAETSGPGSVDRKIHLLSELLRAVSPQAARYVTRIVLGRLRLGIGDPTVLEALALSRGDRAHREVLERAYNLCSDLGLVASTLLRGGLEAVRGFRIRVGNPVRMALCERLGSSEEIIQKMGICAVETKYDGLRVQIHKDGKKIDMYSRSLEPTTEMFPEIAEAVRSSVRARTAILEGEAVAFDPQTGRHLPFQVTVQRKRKHGIEEMAEKIALRFFAFDLLFLDGEDWTARPFEERRRNLEKILMRGDLIRPSDLLVASEASAIDDAFDRAVADGFEGLVVKRLDSVYSAGARNFNWVKLKPSYKEGLSDTVDVCIVGYFLGKGGRARFGIGGVLGAVYDEEADAFQTIAKIGSGFSEDELARLKDLLDASAAAAQPARVQSDIIPDVWVKPRHVITVNADELTRSPMHTAGRDESGTGYALRFPRFVGSLRSDKKAEDATTVKEITALFALQKKKRGSAEV